MYFATYKEALEFGFTSDEIEEANGNFYVELPVKSKFTYYKYKFTCYYFVGKKACYKFNGIHYTDKTDKKEIVKEINHNLKKENSHFATKLKSLVLLNEEYEML